MEQPRYHTTFVLSAPADRNLTSRLVADLVARGIPCKQTPTDAQTASIDERREAEKVIVLCSHTSLAQDWFKSEIADQVQRHSDRLIAVSLDEAWLHSEYRVFWELQDLKPILNQPRLLALRNDATYNATIARLVKELMAEPAAPPLPRGQSPLPNADLARRLASIRDLLILREKAKDNPLAFVSQLLNDIAELLMLKCSVQRHEHPDAPRLYLQLIDHLAGRTPSSRLVRAVEAVPGWNVNTLRSHLDDISTAINNDDSSVKAGDMVSKRLLDLYSLASFLVTNEVDEKTAEAKVQIIMSGTEDGHVEFKSTMRWNLDYKRVDKDMEFEVVRAVAGLANYEGGQLFIGVGDRGQVLGTDADLATFNGQNKADQFSRHFHKLMSDHFGTFRNVEGDWMEYQGKRIWVVTVKGSAEPLFVKDGDFHLRRGPSTVRLSTRDFFEYYVRRWPAKPPPAP